MAVGAFFVEIGKIVASGSGSGNLLVVAKKLFGGEIEDSDSPVRKDEGVPARRTDFESPYRAYRIDGGFSEAFLLGHFGEMGVDVGIIFEASAFDVEKEEPLGLSYGADFGFSFELERLMARKPVSGRMRKRSGVTKSVRGFFEPVNRRRPQELDVFEREEVMAGNVDVPVFRRFEMRRSRKARGVLRDFPGIQILGEKASRKNFEPVVLTAKGEEILAFFPFEKC